MEKREMELLLQISKGIASHFGSLCEVVIHDVSNRNLEHSIVSIENGHVTGRKVGDGASEVVLAQIENGDDSVQDHLGYMTRTPDGKILKSSTLYIRNNRGKVAAILSINFDTSSLSVANRAMQELISPSGKNSSEPVEIINVSGLLKELIEQSVDLIGKPVSMMNKSDKIRAIQFLNGKGVFQVMKSGNLVASYFGISKYTLYAYLDAEKQDGDAPGQGGAGN